MAPILQRCAHCKVYSGDPRGTDKGLMKLCGGCHGKDMSYCDKACQKAGWKDHKSRCQATQAEVSGIERCALVSPLRAACLAQLDNYIEAYTLSFQTAMNSALAFRHVGDITATHVVLFQCIWNKDRNANTPIAEQFSFIGANVVTNAECEVLTGQRMTSIEFDRSVGLGMNARPAYQALLLEVNSTTGGFCDRMAQMPEKEATVIFYVNLDARCSQPAIIHTIKVMTRISYREGIAMPPPPIDKLWKEHLRLDLSDPPLSAAQGISRHMQRYDAFRNSPEGRDYLEVLSLMPPPPKDTRQMVATLAATQDREAKAILTSEERKAEKNSKRG